MNKFKSFYVAVAVDYPAAGLGGGEHAEHTLAHSDDSVASAEEAEREVSSGDAIRWYYRVYGRDQAGLPQAIFDTDDHEAAREIAVLLTGGLPRERVLLAEVVADIAYMAGCHKHYSGDSRRDIATYIHWAVTFEMTRIELASGEFDYRDYPGDGYLIAVEKYTLAKLADAGNCETPVKHWDS